jgi:hypothetical protein
MTHRNRQNRAEPRRRQPLSAGNFDRSDDRRASVASLSAKDHADPAELTNSETSCQLSIVAPRPPNVGVLRHADRQSRTASADAGTARTRGSPIETPARRAPDVGPVSRLTGYGPRGLDAVVFIW